MRLTVLRLSKRPPFATALLLALSLSIPLWEDVTPALRETKAASVKADIGLGEETKTLHETARVELYDPDLSPFSPLFR